ncbi:MAG: hypothetical protein EB072_08095 [Betaproteobacteria bacterium]|nr:hypothetical protein [Betaproteobacteria bacterium]
MACSISRIANAVFLANDQLTRRLAMTISLILAADVGAQIRVPTQELHLSPQGYSGISMTPSARVLDHGQLTIAYDQQIPGAQRPSGYNYQVGLGLFPGFEFVGRLATNDLNCNMFTPESCPPATIRDISASVKWTLPLPWKIAGGPSIAVGATDLGGAATLFRSYYVVASQRMRDFELSLGKAQAEVPMAALRGWFGSLSYRPFDWAQFGAEHIDGRQWISLKLFPTLAHEVVAEWSNALTPYFVVTRSLQESTLTERQWIGFGIKVPLDFSGAPNQILKRTEAMASRTINPIDLSAFREALESRGFYFAKWGLAQDRVVLRIDQTGHPWNLLDAAGNALGILLGVYHQSGQPFRIEITQHGLLVAVLSGDLACARLLMQEGSFCDTGEALSFIDPPVGLPSVQWKDDKISLRRAELVFSPTVTTALGTEIGAIDLDTGLNVNALIPLWTGSYVDVNRVIPLGIIRSEDFAPGRQLFDSRILATTNRKMVHQIVALPFGQNYLRTSTGYVQSSWRGWQIDAIAYAQGGEHRVGLSLGRYQFTEPAANAPTREPMLFSWRYAPKNLSWYDAEFQTGQFWGGDRGYTVTQRFWQGDTSVALYLRRSKMERQGPTVSIAGVQVQMPLTPRSQTGFRYINLRGTSQWTYAVESKVLDKDNRLTPGYGTIPKTGDSLMQLLNRDRIGTDYLNNNLHRLRIAYFTQE